MIKSITGFIMGIATFLQEYKSFQSNDYQRRLDAFVEARGCQDIVCVEQAIKDFDKRGTYA